MGAGAFLLFASVVGCTVTAGTTASGTCSLDSTVSGCQSGAGYSCSGNETPNEANASLSCSSGILGNGGLVLYCCVNAEFTANTCAEDLSVSGCITPSIGFSCVGSAPPQQFDASLTCSTAVGGVGGATLYCCDTAGAAPITTACVADGNVPCGTAGPMGYTCPSGAAPDPSLNCSTGTMESNGETAYCCGAPVTTVGTCAADTTVSCQTAGATGYSCPSGAAPDASLACIAGAPATGGGMTYCCSPPTTITSTCAPNTAVTCVMGVTGYSCTGTDTPWQDTSTLICETTAVSGATGYCCVNSANTCIQATTITDCVAGAFGVACTGTDNPMAASTSLLCGPDPGAMGFCCATN
jgi:hypothetical protein